MYYSARPASHSAVHCVGTATSKTIEGPYTPADTAFACPAALGGAIDASSYKDPATQLRYVVYKIDGNHEGHGGSCNNGVPPLVSTPIKLQQVGSDGVSQIGNPITILDRDASDGPLVEAPSLFRSRQGIYFLFFSSGCFTGPTYNVKYATATDIAGPYTKASAPLIKTGDGPNLQGPGGADITFDGKLMVFHADMDPGPGLKREMFTARPTFSGRTVSI
jgi:beta-xylosidase